MRARARRSRRPGRTAPSLARAPARTGAHSRARAHAAEAQLPTREEKAAHAAGAVVNLRSELEATGTKTSAQCPSCGYGEAYYHEEQTRRADEGSTIIYQCCRCGAHWTNAQ